MPKFAARVALLLVLFVVGLAGGAGTVVSIDDLRCADAVAPPPDAASLDGRARIAFVGDTLLGDAAQPWLEANGYDWPFANLGTLLTADEVIANLEGPITTRTEVYARRSRWSYNAEPATAAALARAGVTVAGLANNHAMDRGPAGLGDTIDALSDAGITSIGAGVDGDAAAAPLLLDTAAGRVAVVALGDHYGSRRIATASHAGGVTYTPCNIVRAASAARRAGASVVVGFVHWGSNYSDVQPSQRTLARLFVDAGYDLVVGHGPHVVQPVELIEGVPVLYSIGNFAFGTPGRFDDEFRGYGLVASIEIAAGALESLELRCILTDNDRVQFQPRPCPVSEASRVLDVVLARVASSGGTIEFGE